MRWVFDRLLSRFGPQGWWPADTPFEVCIGAILVQGTSWRNAERALDTLRRADRLDFDRLHGLGLDQLSRLIRPVGFHRVKAKRLRAFLEFLDDGYRGDAAALAHSDAPSLRRKLLAVHGIGPETADVIALYAAGKHVFIVDAYARRVLSRLGLAEEDASVESIQAWAAAQLPEREDIYNECHALIVELGKTTCRRRPRCDTCPLRQRCRSRGVAAAGEL